MEQDGANTEMVVSAIPMALLIYSLPIIKSITVYFFVKGAQLFRITIDSSVVKYNTRIDHCGQPQ